MTSFDRGRLAGGVLGSLIAGVLIGRLDSSPGWDDTAVTAGLLAIAAAAATIVAGRLPWLVAITTGMFVPLFELAGLANGGPLAAFLFSGVGAAVGWLATRLK